jgi:hypothetical protein
VGLMTPLLPEMAWATSSADANSVPPSPRAARARPIAEVSEFSNADVALIFPSARYSSLCLWRENASLVVQDRCLHHNAFVRAGDYLG